MANVPQLDRKAQVDVGGGRVQSELDSQRPLLASSLAQAILKLLDRVAALAAAREECNLLSDVHLVCPIHGAVI
jgi:hypothetical protein